MEEPSEIIASDPGPEAPAPKRVCRICLESSEYPTIDDREWVRPCLCSGSMEYCHQDCMDKWALYVYSYRLSWLTCPNESIEEIFRLKSKLSFRKLKCSICGYTCKPVLGGWRHPKECVEYIVKAHVQNNDIVSCAVEVACYLCTVFAYVGLFYRTWRVVIMYICWMYTYNISSMCWRLYILCNPTCMVDFLISWTDFLLFVFIVYQIRFCRRLLYVILFYPFILVFINVFVFIDIWDVIHKVKFLDVKNVCL